MISVQETEELHKTLIKAFGGAFGVRDISALSSALERPFQTFAGVDVYSGALEKASALLECVLSQSP